MPERSRKRRGPFRQSRPGGCSGNGSEPEATDPQAESGKTCFHTGQFPYPHREPDTRGEGRTPALPRGERRTRERPTPGGSGMSSMRSSAVLTSGPYPAEAAKETPSRCGGVRRGKGLLPKEDVNRGTPRRRGKRRPGTPHPSGASRMRKGRRPGRGRRESPANRRDRASPQPPQNGRPRRARRSLRERLRHSTPRATAPCSTWR